MKVLLIGGTTGGCGKSTLAVRVTEELGRRDIKTALIDLSPYPSSQWLAENNSCDISHGQSPDTESAAKAVLRPYELKGYQLIILDSSTMNDAALQPWLGIANGYLITTRVDTFSLRAFEGIWDAISLYRNAYSNMRFMGFIPSLYRDDEEINLRHFKKLAGDLRFPGVIPFDLHEERRSVLRHIGGLTPLPDGLSDKSRDEFSKISSYIQQEFELKPVEQPEETLEKGLMVKMWRKAASLVKKTSRPKVEISNA